MFDFMNPVSHVDLDELAKLLHSTPEAIADFEKSYRVSAIDTKDDPDNFFDYGAKDMINHPREEVESTPEIEAMKQRIVNSLISITEPAFHYKDGKISFENLRLPSPESKVTLEEINALPMEARPMLTESLMKVDIDTNRMSNGLFLLDLFIKSQEEHDITAYHMFRQGLDMLDFTPMMYEMLSENPISMSHWLPSLTTGNAKHGFFKIPETTIVRVPMTLLQLSRIDYMSINQNTKDILNAWTKRVFNLDENRKYFIKTGTYSSKYDFRNAKIEDPKEVNELGEYLLFIQYQAVQMASPLSEPVIYGVSTTNEWVVREFIEDKEDNPTIYKGLPLHTEYRIFVDFDTDEILGASPYWRADVMEKKFLEKADESVHSMHDYVIYKAHSDTLKRRYNENIDKVLDEMGKLIPDVDLAGQWSVDIMQNGDDFYLIDMATADTSALSDCVPKEKLNHIEPNWIRSIQKRLTE